VLQRDESGIRIAFHWSALCITGTLLKPNDDRGSLWGTDVHSVHLSLPPHFDIRNTLIVPYN